MPALPRFYFQTGLNIATYDARAAADILEFGDDRPFYVELAVASGGPVLEIGCGTGRVTQAISQAGIDVVGLDFSPAMLEIASHKLPHVEFIKADMTDFDLGREFSLLLMPFRVFQELLTTDAQKEALASAHRHLIPGGRLVLDLQDPRLDTCLSLIEDTRPVQLPLVAHPASGNLVRVEILSRRNDPLRQVFTERWRFSELSQDGSVLRFEEEIHSLRWSWRSELRHLFALSGFSVEAEYSNFDGSPPAYGRDQIWILRKPLAN
jgi:ubiquinone/menaquinone biosynthesis C-methylase UbiE